MGNRYSLVNVPPSRVKDDVNTVDEGFECGVGAREYTGWREGDKISAYEVTNRSPTLE
jgi:translation initiation factor IF-2